MHMTTSYTGTRLSMWMSTPETRPQTHTLPPKFSHESTLTGNRNPTTVLLQSSFYTFQVFMPSSPVPKADSKGCKARSETPDSCTQVGRGLAAMDPRLVGSACHLPECFTGQMLQYLTVGSFALLPFQWKTFPGT